MSNKSILGVYQNFSSALANQTMTGTSVITSPQTNITYKDNIGVQLQWTGTPTGTFTVQGSLDYNPGLPQSGGATGGANAGVWTTINAVDQSGNPPVAAGAPGQILMNLQELCFPWLRIQYTNASGTGTLTGYISGKSIGS